jgi:urease accessory protein
MSRTRKALPRRAAGLGVALLCWPGWALAHSPIAGLNHFYNGVLHPAVVPAHALATVALGLLCSQLPALAGRRVLAGFLGGMVAGLAALALPVAATGAGQALLAGAAVLGLLVATGAPAAVRLLPALGAALGLCLGLDSVPAATPGTLDWSLTLAGQAVGVCLIASATLLLASRLGLQAWQRVARQVMGSWIAASALMVLALGSAALPAAA